MTKQQILKLIDGYLRGREKADDFSKFMDNFLDGSFIPKESIVDEIVYKMIEKNLGEYCWDTIYSFYDNGYGWNANKEDLLKSGYYEKTRDKNIFYIKKEKFDLVKDLKSYKQFNTMEDWFDFNRPKFNNKISKEQILELVDGYCKTIKNNRDIPKFFNENGFIDGNFVVEDSPLGKVVYEFLEDELCYEWYNLFGDIYNKGYHWILSDEDYNSIGPYIREEDAKKMKSYKKLNTIEEVYDFYFSKDKQC